MKAVWRGVRRGVWRWMDRAAEPAGRAAGVVVRAAPGVGGALLVSYGLWLAWAPLGFVCAGGFLLLADRRVP